MEYETSYLIFNLPSYRRNSRTSQHTKSDIKLLQSSNFTSETVIRSAKDKSLNQ